MKIKVNGSTMNYVERGTPGGMPVVFIHGFPFSLESWEPQMRAIPNQYRVIAYDVRGHGQSDVSDGQYTIELFVDDLMALLDHLVIDKAVVCGLSMGGYITLRALERHPERFSGLVLCDTKAEADSNESRIRRASTLKAIKTFGVAQFADGFVKTVFAEKTLTAKPAVVESIRAIIKSTSPIGIGGTLLALASRTDTTQGLSKIRIPTLILCGQYDALTPPKDSELMQKQIKGSTYHRIPDAGHLSNLENPTVFDEHLVAFLKSIH